MKWKYLAVIALVIGAILIASPASAFTAKDLTITVSPAGDATIDFSYELNWLEQFAVFAKIADPAAELKSALENNFHKTVEVTRADSGEMTVVVHSFASVKSTPSGTEYTTPALSFAEAERVLNSYWFAPLVSPDFSPEVTRVIFPDGSTETFENVISIPTITKTVVTG